MVMSSDIRPLRALALMARREAGLPLNSLLIDEAGQLMVRDPAPPSRFMFRFAGFPFTQILTPRADRFHCRLQAHLGYVPYTAQDPHLRAALLTILKGVRGNGIAHFLVGNGQSVWIIADVEAAGQPTPEAVLFETARLLHAVRPYLSVMGEHLPSRP
jgi:hypothetical protein